MKVCIDLLDTPGIIPVKQVEQSIAEKLAFVDSIGENAYEIESIAADFLELMMIQYPDRIKERYGFNEDEQIDIESIAKKRNLLITNSKPDILRASSLLLSDFREGRLGKLTLDEPD